MAEKIESNNEMIREYAPGELYDRPRKAAFIYNAEQEKIYTCPYCKAKVTDEECDVLGAEDNCIFCANCAREFEM